MTSFPKERRRVKAMMMLHISFFGSGRKYNSSQSYVYNFAFPKMDDDLGRAPDPNDLHSI
jgi:hypothetical protein